MFHICNQNAMLANQTQASTITTPSTRCEPVHQWLGKKGGGLMKSWTFHDVISGSCARALILNS